MPAYTRGISPPATSIWHAPDISIVVLSGIVVRDLIIVRVWVGWYDSNYRTIHQKWRT